MSYSYEDVAEIIAIYERDQERLRELLASLRDEMEKHKAIVGIATALHSAHPSSEACAFCSCFGSYVRPRATAGQEGEI